MPRDDDKSLGDEATLQGGKEKPADDRSLGDRSTFGGGEGSARKEGGSQNSCPEFGKENLHVLETAQMNYHNIAGECFQSDFSINWLQTIP